MGKRELVSRAREFRTLPTVAEAMLWDALRDRKLRGVKFRRQVVIGRFVVDFCAPMERLIFEVDGAVHTAQDDRDRGRKEWLEASGYRVVCFQNKDVERNLPRVLSEITNHLRW